MGQSIPDTRPRVCIEGREDICGGRIRRDEAVRSQRCSRSRDPGGRRRSIVQYVPPARSKKRCPRDRRPLTDVYLSFHTEGEKMYFTNR